MIGKLAGKIDFMRKGYAIIDVQGVGYQVFATEVTLGSLAKKTEADLFIHTDVKEDHISLYGFETIDELELFELLISISGVGPKAGLGILTIAKPNTIKSAIVKEDSSVLTQVSGIGKKTAERIVLELKNKIGEISFEESEQEMESEQETVEALISMGYTSFEAREALKMVPSEVEDVSEKIRLALRAMRK